MSIFAAGLPENEATSSLSREARLSLLTDMAIILIGSVSRVTPLLLIIDDGHWIDHSSLTLIKELLAAPGNAAKKKSPTLAYFFFSVVVSVWVYFLSCFELFSFAILINYFFLWKFLVYDCNIPMIFFFRTRCNCRLGKWWQQWWQWQPSWCASGGVSCDCFSICGNSASFLSNLHAYDRMHFLLLTWCCSIIFFLSPVCLFLYLHPSSSHSFLLLCFGAFSHATPLLIGSHCKYVSPRNSENRLYCS